MPDLKFDQRDIKFALFDYCKVEQVSAFDRYEGYDRESFEMVLDSAFQMATDVLALSNEAGDREGVRMEDGQVYLPESFEAAYKAFCENGWLSMHRNAQHGGMQMPLALSVAAIETFIAANPSFMFTPGLTDAAAHLIESFGSDAQKSLFVDRMYTGQWAGTMCLTEPAAGSSVGDLTSKAEPVDGEDYYKIVGNKIFISSGDQQMTENIVHLVLARAEGDPEGIKGISLFIVPKHKVDAEGNILGTNDVTVSGLEHKMGIHASATCTLSFGDNDDCHGYLIGERCKGIVYMFQMMNEARLVTGLQGVAIGNAAYQLALDYAKERKQGPKVTDRSDAPKSVAIIEHPDVRRNLMTMKAYGEAIRALCYKTAMWGDEAHYGKDEASRQKANDLVELLTPVVKAYCSDVGFKMTELAIQVHGGYGYISEYGVEQAMRDSKIASIYEGTNGIQALDLLGRKLRAKNGGLFLTWLQDINGLIESVREDAFFAAEAKVLDASKNSVAEAVFAFPMLFKQNPEYPLLHATPFLRMMGLVVSSSLLLEQSILAKSKLEVIWQERGVDASDLEARRALATNHEGARYYENKIQTFKFFIYQILPETRALLKSIQSNDTSAFDVMF